MLKGIAIKDAVVSTQVPIIERMMHKLCDVTDANQTPRVLIVAIQLPSGGVEIIQNTQHIATKVRYYHDAYTPDGQHKNGAGIQILDFMLI